MGAAAGLKAACGQDDARRVSPSTANSAPEASPTDQAGDAACSHARATLPAYLAGDLGLDALVELRAHLGRCPDCREHLEVGVTTAASLRTRARQERTREQRVERRAQHRKRALQGAFSLSARSPLGPRLRMLLLPAFFVFLMMQTTSGSLAKVKPALTTLRGEVRVDDLPVPPERPRRELRAGDFCRTGDASGARLFMGHTSVRMFEHTGLWIESTSPVRLRLEVGEVETSGAATLTSRLGLIELDGASARVSSRAGRLRVLSHGDGVRVVDSRGVRELGLGDEVELGAGR